VLADLATSNKTNPRLPEIAGRNSQKKNLITIKSGIKKLGGTSFSTEQDLGAKGMQQGSHEGQTGMAHAARFPGRVGPTRSPLVAPMPSIFISMDSS
jgi:hypothetical protein